DPPIRLLRQLGPYPMFGMCLLILVDHVRQRWRAACRRWQGGSPVHSYYNGRPNLLRCWPRLNEFTCKRIVEPAVWAGLGWSSVLSGRLQPGLCLVAPGVALHLTVARRAYREREQALDAPDGLYDMLTPQEAVTAEWEPRGGPRPAAPVVRSPAPL